MPAEMDFKRQAAPKNKRLSLSIRPRTSDEMRREERNQTQTLHSALESNYARLMASSIYQSTGVLLLIFFFLLCPFLRSHSKASPLGNTLILSRQGRSSIGIYNLSQEGLQL